MKTKIIYILTSSQEDIYWEQALISIYSCRLHNKNAEIILVVDSQTDVSLVGKRSELDKYISKKNVVVCPNNYTQAMRSRYLKTTLRRYIKGDFLFVDTDTVITDSLSDIDNFQGDIGVVPEFHCTLNDYPGVEGHFEVAKKLGWEYDENDKYNYNSGVIFSRDNDKSRIFYEQWYKCWLLSVERLGRHQDQPAMAMADHLTNHLITTLDGVWNCQIRERGIYYLSKAKIVHYYGTSVGLPKHAYIYEFQNPDIFAKIKRDGYLSEDLIRKIIDAKSTINPVSHIIVGDDVKLINSRPFLLLKSVATKSPGLFSLMSFGARICSKFIRLFKCFVI